MIRPSMYLSAAVLLLVIIACGNQPVEIPALPATPTSASTAAPTATLPPTLTAYVCAARKHGDSPRPSATTAPRRSR